MTIPGASLKSLQRTNVLNAYRARGRKNHDLWLVYSVKTQQEILLTSDRELIHWICFLETNPQVRTFEIDPDLVFSQDDVEKRATILDAKVYMYDGSVEWHEVKSGSSNKEKLSQESQLIAQAIAASKERANYQVFNDDDLKPKVQLAMRWLKALGYADVIKNDEHIQCQTNMVSYLRNRGRGNIKELIEALSSFAPAVVNGVLVRLAIKDVVGLNLDKQSYGLLTQWEYHG